MFGSSCLLVLALLCGSSLGDYVSTTVPFGGIAAPSSLPRQKIGQLVTGLSDLTSFSFWVIASRDGPVDTTATASVALWNGTTAGAPITTVAISLPAYSASTGYTQVTATLNSLGLDPIADYVIYFETSGFPLYDVYTAVSEDDGGLVRGTGSAWNSDYGANLVFALSFLSIVSVNPSTNFAQGPGSTVDDTSPRWGCRVQTNYGTLQVNWQTLKVNTGYFAGITSNSVLWNIISGCETVYAPYGTGAACWDLQYNQWWSYANIDLTGTNYKVASNIQYGGFLASGHVNYANNNQTADLGISGDCGSVSAPGASLDIGGWDLQLARL